MAQMLMEEVLYVIQRVWLDILEETKKKKAAADKQRKEAATAQERSSTSSFDASNREFRTDPGLHSTLPKIVKNPLSENVLITCID